MKFRKTNFSKKQLIFTVILAVVMVLACALPFFLTNVTSSKAVDANNNNNTSSKNGTSLISDVTVPTEITKQNDIEDLPYIKDGDLYPPFIKDDGDNNYLPFIKGDDDISYPPYIKDDNVIINPGITMQPTIVAQPIDSVFLQGGSTNLEVRANAYGNISYQWHETATKTNIGGTKVEGEIFPNLSVSIDEPGAKYYYCAVTGYEPGYGMLYPQISRTRCASVTMVDVTKGMQWDSKKTYVSGDVVKWAETLWQKVISDDELGYEPGKHESWKESALPKSQVVHAQVPNIASEVQDVFAIVGKEVVMSVTASVESGTLSYQWYSTDSKNSLDGTKIDGAIDSTYSVPNDSFSAARYYFCVVTNTDESESITGDRVMNNFSNIACFQNYVRSEPEIPDVGWEKDRLYLKGEILTDGHRYFRAKRDTKGEQPGVVNEAWDELCFPCTEVVTNIALEQAVIDYENGAKYRSMTIVRFQGELYQATRFTTTTPGGRGWRAIANQSTKVDCELSIDK